MPKARARAEPKAEPKAERKFCAGKSKKGELCKRKASHGDFCRNHQPPPPPSGQLFVCGYHGCTGIVGKQGEHCAKCKDKIAEDKLKEDLFGKSDDATTDDKSPAPDPSGAAAAADPAAPPGGSNPGEVETPGTPPASGEPAQAPDAAAAAAAGQKATDDKTTDEPDEATPWSRFVANIRRSKADDLRKWCHTLEIDYTRWRDEESGDIEDVKGFKNMIVEVMTSRCESTERPKYPTDIYGHGWGYLPRNVEEFDQFDAESCGGCVAYRRDLRAQGCPVVNKFCDPHMLGAVFAGKISFSEYK